MVTCWILQRHIEKSHAGCMHAIHAPISTRSSLSISSMRRSITQTARISTHDILHSCGNQHMPLTLAVEGCYCNYKGSEYWTAGLPRCT